MIKTPVFHSGAECKGTEILYLMDDDANDFDKSQMDEICRRVNLYTALVAGLEWALDEADGWYDDARGGRIDTPKMRRLRALVKRAKEKA